MFKHYVTRFNAANVRYKLVRTACDSKLGYFTALAVQNSLLKSFLTKAALVHMSKVVIEVPDHE